MPETTFLTPHQLCRRWANAVTPKTLANWRSKRDGPTYYRLKGRVLYRLDDVLAWEKANGK
jgi:hypothetical protein